MSRRQGDLRGSVLAALMAALAVMSILMTVAMTQWSFIVQREKEKELIFRGTAIVRGIQEFQQRFGRAPVSLEEMTKSRPPCLRQVLPDPMTARYDRDGELTEGTGQWTFISAMQGTSAPPGPPPDSADSSRRGPAVTPFVGVRSKAEDLFSIGSYKGSEPGVPYSEWRFQVLVGDPANRMQHVGGIEPLYPPGFGGLRAPGGPPFTGGPTPPGGGTARGQAQAPPR